MSPRSARPVEAAGALLQRRRYADAIRLARSDIEANGPSAYALRILAVAYLQTNDQSAALEAARAAVDLEPADAVTLLTLAYVHADRGERRQALELTHAATASDPDHAGARSLLASLELSADRPRLALEAVAQGKTADPARADLYVTAALALLDLRRFGDAQSEIEAALALDPQHAGAFEAAGFIALARDDAAAAQAALRSALRIDPQRESAQRALVIALKLRSPFYRLVRGRYWRFTLVAMILLVGLLARVPATVPLAIGLFIAGIVAFSFSDRLFTLRLAADRIDRRLLDQRELRAALWFGAALAVMSTCTALALLFGNGALGFAAGALGFAVAYLHVGLERPPGRVRTGVLGGVCVFIGVAAALTLLLLATGERSWEAQSEALRRFAPWGDTAFLIGLAILLLELLAGLAVIIYQQTEDAVRVTQRAAAKLYDIRSTFRKVKR